MNTKKLLMSSSYLIIPINMLKKIGLYPVIILSELATRESFYQQNGTIGSDGYFFMTSKDMENATTLSRYKQDEGLKVLVDNGLIIQDVRGLPGVRYFKLLDEAINLYFAENSQTTLRSENSPLCEKPTTSNSIYIDNNINNNDLLIDENNLQTQEEEKEVGVLFPAFDTSKPTEFKDSIAFDNSVFEAAMKKEENLGVDIHYYKNLVDEWCEKLSLKDKRKKRTARGWIATARQFMRGDNDKGKLRFVGSKKEFQDAEAKAFLSI